MDSTTESLAYNESTASEPPARGNVYLIGSVFLAVALGIAALSLMGGYTTIKLIQAFAFLLAGYGFVAVLAARLSRLTEGEQWLYGVVLTVVTALAVAAGYFFYNRLNWSVVLLQACAFFLPFAIAKTREAFNDLVGTAPLLWFYSPGMAARLAVVSLHSTPLRIKLKARAESSRTELISFSAPGRMKIGEILFHVISEQNSNTDRKIEWANGDGEPYGWAFYKFYWGGLLKRYLRPDSTLIDNNVGRNAAIVAKRVQSVTR